MRRDCASQSAVNPQPRHLHAGLVCYNDAAVDTVRATQAVTLCPGQIGTCPERPAGGLSLAAVNLGVALRDKQATSSMSIALRRSPRHPPIRCNSSESVTEAVRLSSLRPVHLHRHLFHQAEGGTARRRFCSRLVGRPAQGGRAGTAATGGSQQLASQLSNFPY